jgi:cell division septation protein DedD
MMAALLAAVAYGVIGLQARAVSVRPADYAVAPEPAETQPRKPAQTQALPAARLPQPVSLQPPAAAAAADRSGRAGYAVLVGSFRVQNQAATLLDQLRALGYRTYANRVGSAAGNAWHQVFVGPYDDLNQARQDEARVRQLPAYADAHVVTP